MPGKSKSNSPKRTTKTGKGYGTNAYGDKIHKWRCRDCKKEWISAGNSPQGGPILHHECEACDGLCDIVKPGVATQTVKSGKDYGKGSVWRYFFCSNCHYTLAIRILKENEHTEARDIPIECNKCGEGVDTEISEHEHAAIDSVVRSMNTALETVIQRILRLGAHISHLERKASKKK